VTLVSFWMLAHAGEVTARGVIQGLLGGGSSFLRTPKKGAALDRQPEGSAEMAE